MDALAGYYFHQGTNSCAYDYLGCHERTEHEGSFVFRVWAPNARSVGLVGDFCSWTTPLPMTRITEGGVYETTVDGDLVGCAYKFYIVGPDGVGRYKGDPYAFASRGRDDGASIVCERSSYAWHDAAWLRHRRKTVVAQDGAYLSTPINIYELHAASFLRKDGAGEGAGYYSYRELADVLVPYVKYMGYTHVELLPIAEYPFDGSWGYQVGAFYAPTARHGTPDDLRYFVDSCHRSGIGVLLDWVPAHFPKDAWGLFEFDGVPLYEYQGRDRMESSWGTRYFDLGREEVQSFLISNALYFLREFHIDGLRVDAVASMLYLDFDRRPGEWVPNANGGRENLEAIAFLKKLNGCVLGEFPDALMIAEESTAYPGVTHPVSAGGLGFSLKWNMGLANDLYDYVSADPIYRKHHHGALTFPLMYAFSENYVLPISHDEVVHGKRSFIDKMHGSYEDKFRQARVALLLLMTYPGKKMLFMGTEFAQFREWDYASSLEWFMLEYPMHRAFRDYVAALNRMYLSRRELWDLDFSREGFTWLLADENEKNAVAFCRSDRRGKRLIVALSFSGAPIDIPIPVRRGVTLTPIFTTDDTRQPTLTPSQTDPLTVHVTLPAFYGVILRETKKTRTYTLDDNYKEQNT